MKSIPADALRKGMVLALPFGRTARIESEVIVGTRFVTFVTEHGKSRVSRYAEVEVV